MKSKEEIMQRLFATLAELQSGTTTKQVCKRLCIELAVLNDILGDDVPEEYWEQIEEFI